MNFRLELHHMNGLFMLGVGVALLVWRSDAGVAGAIDRVGVRPALVGWIVTAGGALYLASIVVRRFDNLLWHLFCTLWLLPYTLFSYVFWLQSESGVAFFAYAGAQLLMAVTVLLHHKSETIVQMLEASIDRVIKNGSD